MNKPKAIIFDADGTLLNSFELIAEAYLHVAKTHSLEMPAPEKIRAQMGKSIPDIIKSLWPEASVEVLLHTNNEFMAANAMKSEAFEGVHELLHDLKEQGLKLAILTSGGHRIVDILKHHNINHCFDSIVHHERIENPKPDPEGFILACKEIGVEVHEAIMVGDTPTDIETAVNSNAYASIGVTHGYALEEDLHSSNPDYTVSSIEGIRKVIQELMN